MRRHVSALLFILFSVAPVGVAVRVSELQLAVELADGQLAVERHQEVLAAIVEEPQKICGGPDIWNLIAPRSGFSDVYMAQNVQWEKIVALKKTHMERQQDRANLLQKRLDKLGVDLMQAFLDEDIAKTSTEQHRTLILAGVGEGSYSSLEIAHDYKCGKVRRPIPPVSLRNAFASAEKLFVAAAVEFFEVKKRARLDGDGFLADCHKWLVQEKDTRTTSYCPGLCQRFKNAAESSSFKGLSVGMMRSAALKDQVKAVADELQVVKNDMNQCESDFAAISGLKEQILAAMQEYESITDKWQDAESALADLDEELAQVDDRIEASLEMMDHAETRLQEAKEGAADARVALADAADKAHSLKGKISASTKQLTSVKADLESATGASTLVLDIKQLVTNTMFLMEQFSKKALREPLINLGFDTPAVGEVRQKYEASRLEARKMLTSALGGLSGFCKDTAMPLFQKVTSLTGHDMSPLCGFDEPEAVFDDVKEAVLYRSRKIDADVKTVVSWLNPYRDSSKTVEEGDELELNLTADGQLAGLEAVKSVYKEPKNDWFSYLVDWRKDGPHHQLVARLETQIATLKQKKASLEELLKELTPSREEALKAAKKAAGVLTDLVQRQALRDEQIVRIEEYSAKLYEEAQQMRVNFDSMQDMVDQLYEAMMAAEAAMVAIYVKGIA